MLQPHEAKTRRLACNPRVVAGSIVPEEITEVAALRVWVQVPDENFPSLVISARHCLGKGRGGQQADFPSEVTKGSAKCHPMACDHQEAIHAYNWHTYTYNWLGGRMHTYNCSWHFEHAGSSHQVGTAGSSGRRGLIASRPISRGQRFLSIPMRCTIGARVFDDSVFGVGNAARSLHQALDSHLRGWPRSLASNTNVIILAILCKDRGPIQQWATDKFMWQHAEPACLPLRLHSRESASHFEFFSFRHITSHPTAVLREVGLGSRSEHSSYLSHLPSVDASSTGEISPPLLWIDQELEVTICCTPYQVINSCML